MDYFYPGALIMIVLFTSIFTMMSVIEDRKEGFLLSVLVAPVPRSAIVLGKVLGGTTLSAIQGMIFLVFAPFAGIHLNVVQVLLVAVVVFLVSFALTALGFAIAWPMDSTQAFHGIINLFLIPLWLLSGALFPMAGASRWIRALMYMNPLTYGVEALRSSALSGSGGHVPSVVGHGDAASVFAGDVWTGVPDGQPPHARGRPRDRRAIRLLPCPYRQPERSQRGAAVRRPQSDYARKTRRAPRLHDRRGCLLGFVFGLLSLFSRARGRHSFSWAAICGMSSISIVLIPHVMLAIVIVPMVIITLIRGLTAAAMIVIAPSRAGPGRCGCMFQLTGVIVYFMLYRWFPHS